VSERCPVPITKKDRWYMLASEGDTLPAFIVQLHHYLAGSSSSTNGFCFQLTAISTIMMARTHCNIVLIFSYNEFAGNEEK
jgi:hypothetical protein